MTEAELCLGCMLPRKEGEFCTECGWQHGSFPKSPVHLAPGSVLRDQYLLGRVLGYGGFGVTYLAWDLNLATRLAVKEYLPSGLATRTAGLPDVTPYSGTAKEHFELGLEKFLEEARLLARFKDLPNVVSVLNFFRANGTAYMVMEYLEGTTLEQYLQMRGGKLPIEEAVAYIAPVVQALSRVHREAILHRDVSPDNMYLTQGGVVKLLDFGAARFALGQQSKNLSVILKEGYSPEEQYRSKGVQGPWTDVYAVAATLYRCITGVLPPPALDRLDRDELIAPRALGVSLSAAAERAILKALAVRMQDRYQSVEDFRDALLAGPVAAQQVAPQHAGAQATTAGEQTRSDPADQARGGTPSPHANKKLTYGAAAAAGLALIAFFATGERRQDIELPPKSPPAATDPVIRSFVADPQRVGPNGFTKLSWSAENTSMVRIEPKIGMRNAKGSLTVPVRENTTFVLSLMDRNGNVLEQRKAEVVVDSASRDDRVPERASSEPVIPPGPSSTPPSRSGAIGGRLAIDEFSVSPSVVPAGQRVVVRWSTSGASDVTINGTKVGANGATPVEVSTDSTFNLFARAPNGATEHRSVQVQVRRSSPEVQQRTEAVNIDHFVVQPATVAPGQAAVLQWSADGVDSVTILPEIGQMRAHGQTVVRPRSTTEYTIRAGNRTQTAVLVVRQPSSTSGVVEAQSGDSRAVPPSPQRQQPASAPVRTFQVVHDHGGVLGKVSGLGGLAGRLGRSGRSLPQSDSCRGTLTVQNGTVRFHSNNSEHGFSEAVSSIAEVKRNRLDAIKDASFHIKLRSGENYNFTPQGASVDEVVRALGSGQQ